MGLPPGLIENVTDGQNAWLVGIDDDGRVLATEEAIVASGHTGHVRDIFLLARPARSGRSVGVRRGSGAGLLAARAPIGRGPGEPEAGEKIRSADLIIYAPGTQHSSLFPSYSPAG